MSHTSVIPPFSKRSDTRLIHYHKKKKKSTPHLTDTEHVQFSKSLSLSSRCDHTHLTHKGVSLLKDVLYNKFSCITMELLCCMNATWESNSLHNSVKINSIDSKLLSLRFMSNQLMLNENTKGLLHLRAQS